MGETYALLPAAGSGARFRSGGATNRAEGTVSVPYDEGGAANKLLVPLAGKPVLAHTLLAFERCDEIRGILLVGNPAALDEYRRVAEAAGIRKPVGFVEGGSTRQESVSNGLAALPPAAEIVAIHDAARPLVTPEIIARTVQAAQEHGAALAGIPVIDTVKRVSESGVIVETLTRSELIAAQTPQTFRVPLIRDAHARAAREGFAATDDAALVERMGHPVRVVPGDRRNLKVTTPEDLILAECLLATGHRASGVGLANGNGDPSLPPERRTSLKDEADSTPVPDTRYPIPDTPFRVGFGYDIHRLTEGRRLVLGGVEIPHPVGLEGHSDADVLLHALMDALLGAAGLPDIGHLFPNTDERWRGASSRAMLREVAARLKREGWIPSNVDLTLIAERPKIAPHLSAMREAMARDLGISESCVGIKATTNERVGAVGREEAMAAQAVAMLVPARGPANPTIEAKEAPPPAPELPLDPF